MKFLALAAVSLSTLTCAAQSTKATATPAALPPFAGRWVLNLQRSKLMEPVKGINTAVIVYDGKTWTYIHRHQDTPDDDPQAWQATYTVDSPTPHVSNNGADITFRSRIQRMGTAMLMTETGVTLNHQQVHTTIRYTLEDQGNTLVETEVSVGPLGPQKNVYVLEREGTGSAPVGN
jgi:Neuraminidase (sialidase)